MSALPLEDNFNDILGKALRGLKLAPSDAAAQAGVSTEALQSLLGGEFDAAAARKVAPVLGLHADSVVASGEKSWAPKPVSVDGLAQFTTPWEDMMVNSYVVFDPATKEAAVFDSGADCSPMLDFIAEKGLKVKFIGLTHTHGDHIFDLDRLKARTGAPAYVGDREPIDGAESFAAGRAFSIGGLSVETRLTWGHSKGGITFLIDGLAQPVAVVGDAVFAGSMGGGGISYADALATNRKEILTLPDETVVCSGHGPLTTVGEQKQHNPFFASSFA
jgi:glyoxylase-like metal-dependent hydrolase (beta-lactamase superfamily II)